MSAPPAPDPRLNTARLTLRPVRPADRVRAQTMAINLGSRRVLEKAGFRHVETVFPAFAQPIPGSEQGEVIYEVRRDRARSAR